MISTFFLHEVGREQKQYLTSPRIFLFSSRGLPGLRNKVSLLSSTCFVNSKPHVCESQVCQDLGIQLASMSMLWKVNAEYSFNPNEVLFRTLFVRCSFYCIPSFLQLITMSVISNIRSLLL